MCSDKVVDAIRWPSDSDYSLEKQLVLSDALQLDKISHGGMVFLKRGAVVDDENRTAEETTHWYRSMTKTEFDMLWKWNMIQSESYFGIAPNRSYVYKYFTEKSAGSHIVEFGPTLQLALDEDFSIYGHFHERGFSLKAEGGGTFGLGETGSSSAKQAAAVKKWGTGYGPGTLGPEKLEAMKTPSDLFTEWLAKGKIYRKLVNLKVPGKANVQDLLS
jgi:hypothetical protein